MKRKVWISVVIIIGIAIFFVFNSQKKSIFPQDIESSDSETLHLFSNDETGNTEIPKISEDAVMPDQVMAYGSCPTQVSVSLIINKLNIRLAKGFAEHCYDEETSSQCPNFAIRDESKNESGPIGYDIEHISHTSEDCKLFVILARKGLRDAEDHDSYFKLSYEGFYVSTKDAVALMDLGDTLHQQGGFYVGTQQSTCGLENVLHVISNRGTVLFDTQILDSTEAQVQHLEVLPPEKYNYFSLKLETHENPKTVGQVNVKDSFVRTLEFNCTKQKGCFFEVLSETREEVRDQGSCDLSTI